MGRFLFRNEAVFQQISSLSGGERARLTLLKMMLSGPNVLILDEPTNHLDIRSKEVVEDALLDFPGTVIVVSHDRYFLNKVPTRIMELTPTGLESYLGGYDYFIEKKQSIASGKKYLQELNQGLSSLETNSLEGNSSEDEKEGSEINSSDSAVQRRKNKEAEAMARKNDREKKKWEEKISELEEEIFFFQEEMCKEEVFSNHIKLSEYHEKVEISKAELSKAYEEWLGLQE